MGFFAKLFRKKRRSTKKNKQKNNQNDNLCDDLITMNQNDTNENDKIQELEEEWRQKVSQANQELEYTKSQSVHRERELVSELQSLKEKHEQFLLEQERKQKQQEQDLLEEQQKQKQKEEEEEEKEKEGQKVQRAVEEARKTWKEEHANEIDELLIQLDLVEDEHREEMERLKVEKEEAVSKVLLNQSQESTASSNKNSIVDTEERQRIDSPNNKNAVSATKYLETKVALETAQRECTRLSEQLAETILAHERVLVKERREHADTCQRIKKKMIKAAEEQFSRANEIYDKLKKEYETLKMKNDALEQDELPKLKQQVEYSMTNQLSKDAENKENVAQLKIDLANAETSLAKATREYGSEMELWGITKQNLLERLQLAEMNCAAAHQSLATLHKEKEELQYELDDTKNVCEELMTLAENAYTSPNNKKNNKSNSEHASTLTGGHHHEVAVVSPTAAGYHHHQQHTIKHQPVMIE